MLSLFIVGSVFLLAVASFVLARVAVARLLGLGGGVAALASVPEGARALAISPRLVFAAAGPLAWYLVAVLAFTLSLSLGGEARTDTVGMRVTPARGSPASAGGVEDGDRVVSVDGAPVADWTIMRARIQANPGHPVPIVVDRAGRQIELHPLVGTDGRLGVFPFREHRDVGAAEAVVRGFRHPLGVLGAFVRGLVHVVQPVDAAGPVAIVSETARRGRDEAPVARALGAAGILVSYFLGAAVLLALILFPRAAPIAPT